MASWHLLELVGEGEIEAVMLGKYRAVVEGNEDYMAVLHCTHVQSSQA